MEFSMQMIFADRAGKWLDFPPLEMAAQSGSSWLLPRREQLIPLPLGATLTMLPGARPIGYDSRQKRFISLEYDPYQEGKMRRIFPVGALLPQGFTRLLLPALKKGQEKLPLLGYTAVGIEKGRLYVAARQTDEHSFWHPKHYNTRELALLIKRRLEEFPNNRIVSQLAHCSREYGCFTAQNLFYRRWEAGIPVSPDCNAACLGCISLQPAECCPSPQQRLDFVPAPREVAEPAIAHLEEAQNAIISFGQGCEGEPGLQSEMLAEAIGLIREQTKRGIININTNGGNDQGLAQLMAAGLDSLRLSLFSALPQDHRSYHQPKDFDLDNIKNTLAKAKEAGVKVALNWLVYPGFSDQLPQMEAIAKLAKEGAVAQIQLRNLNIDPGEMQKYCTQGPGLGMDRMINWLERELPEVKLGSFTRR